MDDLVITSGENVLIMDNGCDQSIVNISAFLVETHLGVYFTVRGAFKGMHSSDLELVNNAYTVVQQESGELTRLFLTQMIVNLKLCFNLIKHAPLVWQLMMLPSSIMIGMAILVVSALLLMARRLTSILMDGSAICGFVNLLLRICRSIVSLTSRHRVRMNLSADFRLAGFITVRILRLMNGENALGFQLLKQPRRHLTIHHRWSRFSRRKLGNIYVITIRPVYGP